MGTAATNKSWARFTERLSPLCPSCIEEEETCGHVLMCCKAGRVENLLALIQLLDQWLGEQNTNPSLRYCIVEYAKTRGHGFMYDICRGMDPTFLRMARAQDSIGWRCFMEGMIVSNFHQIQRDYFKMCGLQTKVDKWVASLITKLLECTHGQWI